MATPELLQQVEQLKIFLATAPANWEDPNQSIQRFCLPNGDTISCVLWKNVFYMTGTEIVKCLVFRFHAIGRPVKNIKKFEEGIFSDLRNLKAGVDAALEEPRSEFLEFLYKHSCIRTQKKQKVFYWYSVPHDRLFMDALERDLKREASGQETATVPTPSFQLPMALQGALLKPPMPGISHSPAMLSAGSMQHHSTPHITSTASHYHQPPPMMNHVQHMPYMNPTNNLSDVKLEDWMTNHQHDHHSPSSDPFPTPPSAMKMLQSGGLSGDNQNTNGPMQSMEEMSNLLEKQEEQILNGGSPEQTHEDNIENGNISRQPTPDISSGNTSVGKPVESSPPASQSFLATPPLMSSPVPFLDGSPNYKQRRRSAIFRGAHSRSQSSPYSQPLMQQQQQRRRGSFDVSSSSSNLGHFASKDMMNQINFLEPTSLPGLEDNGPNSRLMSHRNSIASIDSHSSDIHGDERRGIWNLNTSDEKHAHPSMMDPMLSLPTVTESPDQQHRDMFTGKDFLSDGNELLFG